MVVRLLAFMIGIILIIPEATPRNNSGHFPLENCFRDVDMMFLLTDMGEEGSNQYSLVGKFAERFTELLSRTNGSQLLVAEVLDHFSSHNVSTGAGNWSFETFQYGKQTYQNLSLTNLQTKISRFDTVLEQKIQFVERLFNEMRGVRRMAIHIGVIFLDGTGLTQEEVRNVSTMVQQRHSSDVKIFVVVISDALVHLTDTLVLKKIGLTGYDRTLMMAMCSACFQDEILLKHTVGTQFLSCYKLDTSQEMLRSSVFYQCLFDSGNLVTIETTEELMFLQHFVHEFIENNSKSHSNDSYKYQMFIGLYKDTRNYVKRFWWDTGISKYNPMTINHWLPGKPSKHTLKKCVMWQFRKVWKNNRNGSDSIQAASSNEEDFIDGWEDINCETGRTTLSVCEFSLPLKAEHFFSIKPASRESFETALKRGDFVQYKGNIVSVSEYLTNADFLQVLKNNNENIPMFDCGEDAGQQRYIPYSLVCDFTDHCSNKQDETFCLKNPLYCESGQPLVHSGVVCDNVRDCTDGSDEGGYCEYLSCNGVRCCDSSCLPLRWVNDGEFDCYVCKENSSLLSDESLLENININCVLICNRDQCVNISQLNDGIIDCLGPEGPIDETLGKLEPANTCKNIMGHTIWAPKCVYVVDRYGGIIGCRDMSHLRECENFLCPEGYVKCPGAYCIPQHYLLDGKADCPTGEDEQPFYIGPCTGNFACWGSKVCLYPDLVCDGHADCPHKDDELGCQVCPEGFRCTGGTVTVSGYNSSTPLKLRNVRFDKRTTYLDFSGVDFLATEMLIFKCTNELLNLKILILSKCNISTLYLRTIKRKGYSPLTITKLDVSYNQMREIFSNHSDKYEYRNINYLNVSFNAHLISVKNLQFSFLKILDLSHTGLSYLDDSVFAGLPMLKHLNLSHTLISDFSRKYFSDSFTLQSLDLRGMPIVDFHSFSFHDLTVSQNLYADHIKICCPQIRGRKIPSHACQAPVDAISSCFHLVKLPVQRVLLWVVAVLAVLGNMAVIVYRVIWDRSVLKTGYGLFVINLSVSDVIMGVYLFIIAGADYFFRDVYVLHEKTWKQSVLCRLAGFMATLSSEASTFFVFLITLERYLVMKFPFGENSLLKVPKIALVGFSWFACFSLSLIPIVFNFDLYSTNAMCLGLPLTKIHGRGWAYPVAVLIIFNFFMFLIIAYGQCAIFRAVLENRISNAAISMSRSRRAEDITVAKQLSLVVLSNFLCWFPIGLMGFMSLGGHNVSDEVYAWTTVLLLPINSAVNPVLYTIPALLARWEKFKYGDQRTFSTAA